MNKTLQSVFFLIFINSVFCLKITTKESDIQFCWRHSYTRTDGTDPICPNGIQSGLFCYENCEAQHERFGDTCRTKCPVSKDWRDDGAFCRQVAWSRPSFPTKFGEFNTKGMFNRCEAVYGVNNCEILQKIVYPKCPEGYLGTTTSCIPHDKPDCNKLDLLDGPDIICMKKNVPLKALKPTCPPNTDLDGGKCYTKCKEGYEGLGTRCYSVSPKHWIECGLGHALNEENCEQMKNDKVFKLYFKIYIIALDAIDNKCKALCDVKKAARKIYKLLLKIDKEKLEVHTELVKALKHEELFKELTDLIKTYLQGSKKDRKELEAILLKAEALINTFDPTLFIHQIGNFKYPICRA